MFTIINAIIFICVNNNTGSVVAIESNFILSIISILCYFIIIIKLKEYHYLLLIFHGIFDCFIILGYNEQIQFNRLFYIFALLQIIIGVFISIVIIKIQDIKKLAI
jgi:hypothetical protein